MIENFTFNNRGELIYKGVNLGITRETIQDYKKQTGMDIDLLLTYNRYILALRDKKIKEILG